jgi:drug/metabolite transporter (DMT)-like permease
VLVAPIAWFFLGLRIVLLGLERPLGKKVVVGYPSDVGGFAFYGAAAVALIPTLIIYARFHPPTSWQFLPYAFLTSALFMLPFVFYIKALDYGEVSVITPLYYLGTLFVFILPIAFQGERFTWLKLAGALLIFAGTLFLRPGANPWASLRNLISDRGARFILLNTLLLSVIRLIDNRMADFDPIFYAITCAMLNGVFFGIAVLFTRRWRQLWELVRTRAGFVATNGLVNGHAYVALLASLGAGLDMSIAEPVSNSSMLLAVVLGHYMFGEKIQARLIASLLMLAGVFMLVRG